MTLDDFAKITRRVISEDGFEGYLPTACYPIRREIKALEGLPSDLAPEEPVLEWAAESAGLNEEFLVAFKVDDSRFKVIRRIGPFAEEQIYSVD
jgi:hypothetical protein